MSGEVLRAEKDYSKEVDKLLPEAEKLAKASDPLAFFPCSTDTSTVKSTSRHRPPTHSRKTDQTGRSTERSLQGYIY